MGFGINSIWPAPPPDPAPIKVLAFDQSSHCGWAILWPEMKRPEWGVLDLPIGPDEDESPALENLYGFIERAVLEKAVTHVFFEQPMMPSKEYPATIHGQRQWMLVATIMVAARRLLGRSAEQVSSQAWRKLFLGQGNLTERNMRPGEKLANRAHRRKAWKTNAIAMCVERGWLVDNDNAAEALGIGVFGLASLSQRFLVSQGSLFRRAEMNAERIP